MQRILQRFVASQVCLSKAFDRLLSSEYSVDGNWEYIVDFAPRYLRPGAVIWDVGGGKNPFVNVETKKRLGLHVTGLDISRAELDAAPPGCHDRTVCADITTFNGGQGEADVVFCQAVLEHVPDTAAAVTAIGRILKPGGCAVLFVPARNAAYARLNILLPESLKRTLLFTIHPDKERNHGFPAYYDHCTPGAFRKIAQGTGLRVEQMRSYFCSAYFRCFFPVHFIWRLWLMAFRRLAGEQAAEAFSIALRREEAPIL